MCNSKNRMNRHKMYVSYYTLSGLNDMTNNRIAVGIIRVIKLELCYLFFHVTHESGTEFIDDSLNLYITQSGHTHTFT